MHIPDGFLDSRTWGTLSVVSGAGFAYAARRGREVVGDKHVPAMGVMAAFVFAAQMLNFPVAAGTSGHFMGAALAAILLGPLSALLVMTTVLAVQCLLFSDGGLTALGANVFNMGIAGSFAGYWVARGTVKLLGEGKFLAAAFLGAWLSIVAAASCCAMELAVSGVLPFRIVFPAMAGVHALIGIGEGLITVAVLAALRRARPDLLALKKI